MSFSYSYVLMLFLIYATDLTEMSIFNQPSALSGVKLYSAEFLKIY